ncbi:MAG TPA: lysylphosphatidylglycerol synthase transmembrane domain-containing protein [Chthoniobacterales bacterium]|nr:lysylphosphatidylglycerol synthase transmembrane domain-containing protein [Chthoniobacterales bacterium]
MKRAVITTLQIAVSLALIAWIFHDPHKREQISIALKTAQLGWFLPALAAFGAALLLQTQRWHVLLRAIGINFAWLRTWQLVMVGMFFNFVLPGATGGDVVKIFYAMREAKSQDKAAAFLSVVLDRVAGLLALAFVSVFVVIWKFQALMSTPIAQGLLLMIAIILAGSVGVIVASVVVAARRLEDRLPERMPLRRGIVDLAVAIRHYAKSPRALLAVFGISIVVHLLMFLVFYFSGRAFVAALGIAEIYSVMPIINTITALPLSLQGVGVREQLFEKLLNGLYGTPVAIADLISMGGYLVSVAWSLVGGLAFMLYRPSDGQTASLKEMSAATQDIAEHPGT